MRIGLFFGSFNPIHIGHLIIAESMVENAKLHQVWFVVSPQNPFKKKKNLLHEQDRLYMVRQAISENNKFNVSDIEFHMPRPSYTVDTLAYLHQKHPQHEFKLIVGQDNLKHFPKWKNYKVILENHGLLVYPRPAALYSPIEDHPNVQMVEAPEVDISATYIRACLRDGRSVRYLVHPDVEAFIRMKKLYA